MRTADGWGRCCTTTQACEKAFDGRTLRHARALSHGKRCPLPVLPASIRMARDTWLRWSRLHPDGSYNLASLDVVQGFKPCRQGPRKKVGHCCLPYAVLLITSSGMLHLSLAPCRVARECRVCRVCCAVVQLEGRLSCTMQLAVELAGWMKTWQAWIGLPVSRRDFPCSGPQWYFGARLMLGKSPVFQW
jgi:hypothetical protein